MKLIIEVPDSQISERSGKTKDGRDWEIREQEGYLHIEGKPFPVEMKLQLNAEQTAYKPGKYEVLASSVRVSRFGQLEFKRNINMVPLLESPGNRTTD